MEDYLSPEDRMNLEQVHLEIMISIMPRKLSHLGLLRSYSQACEALCGLRIGISIEEGNGQSRSMPSETGAVFYIAFTWQQSFTLLSLIWGSNVGKREYKPLCGSKYKTKQCVGTCKQ